MSSTKQHFRTPREAARARRVRLPAIRLLAVLGLLALAAALYGLVPVQAQTDNTPPTFLSTDAATNVGNNGRFLFLNFDENLTANLPPTSAFSVTADGRNVPVTSVDLGGFSSVSLALGDPIGARQVVKVSYTDPTSDDDTNAIQDAAGNDVVSFSDITITNNSTRPPLPQSLRATAGTGQVSLSWTIALESGEVLTRYDYRVSSDAGATWGAWTEIPSSASLTSYNVSGLDTAAAGHFTFQLRAVNSTGDGPAAETSVVIEGSTPDTLIKNTGQAPRGTGGRLTAVTTKSAQSFRTGANASGYRLSTVGIAFLNIADTSTAGDELVVTLNGFERRALDNVDFPGELICTLTNPSSFFSSGVHTFSAPTSGSGVCPTLSAETSYFVVVERTGSRATDLWLHSTSTSSVDSGNAPGWTLPTSRRVLDTEEGGWKAQLTYLQINVRGEADPLGVNLSGDTLTVAEGGSGTYTIVLGKQPSANVTISISAGAGVTADRSSVTFTTTNWSDPQTVTVSAAQDDDRVDDSVTISHEVAAGSAAEYVALTDLDDLDVIVRDDDTGATLVKNTTSTRVTPIAFGPAMGGPSRVATQFTTGSNDRGYTLGSIGIDFDAISDTATAGDDLEVTLNQSTLNPDTNLDQPGDPLCTLSDPLIFTADTVNLFAAPTTNPCPTLTKETKYFVVVRRVMTTDSSTIFLGLTNSPNEDPGAAAGWSIGNVGQRDSDSSWRDVIVFPRIEVRGEAVALGVNLSRDSLTVVEGGSSTYTIVLGQEPTGNVTIDISVTGDVTADRSSATFTPSNWNVPQTVTVRADQDDDEANEAATITHAVSSGSAAEYRDVSVDDVKVTVFDDDGPSILVRNSPESFGGFELVDDTTPRLAQRFSTGSHALGYELSAIDLWFASVGSTATTENIAAALYSVANGKPDQQLCELVPPAAFAGGDFGEDPNTFTAPSDADACPLLRPNTTYAVVLKRVSGSPEIGWAFTSSTSEDTLFPPTGFSIADRLDEYSNGAWSATSQAAVLVMQIQGLPRTIAVTLAADPLPVIEGGSSTYTIVLGRQPAANVTINISITGGVTADRSSVTFTTSNWNDPQTVTVSAPQDDDVLNDAATIVHSITSGSAAGYRNESVDDVDVIVFDEDGATANICDRTWWVREEILRQNPSSQTCANARLVSIVELDFSKMKPDRLGRHTGGLDHDDLRGLTNLTRLDLSNLGLLGFDHADGFTRQTMPEGLFSDLTKLTYLSLAGNKIHPELPDGAFEGLSGLTELDLRGYSRNPGGKSGASCWTSQQIAWADPDYAWNPRLGSPKAFVPLTSLATYNWDPDVAYATDNYQSKWQIIDGPTNLMAQAAGKMVGLSWTAPTNAPDNIRYRIERDFDGRGGHMQIPVREHNGSCHSSASWIFTLFDRFGERVGQASDNWFADSMAGLNVNQLQHMDSLKYYVTAETDNGLSLPVSVDVDMLDSFRRHWDYGFAVRDANVYEGRGTLDFEVTLRERPGQGKQRSVRYATLAVGATATEGYGSTCEIGEDYLQTAGTLVFQANEVVKTVSVPICDDEVDDSWETLFLLLSNATGGTTIQRGGATGLIVNSEDPNRPLWSAEMTVHETSRTLGALSTSSFNNIGGSGELTIKRFWYFRLTRALHLSFEESIDNAEDYSVVVGDLSLEFPDDSSGDSSFSWRVAEPDWDAGEVITVRVVPTAALNAQAADTSVTDTPTEEVAEQVAEPVNSPATGLPTISGIAQAGETLTALTANIADADGLSGVSYAYQWLRNNGNADSEIAGQTGSSYVVSNDDVGRTIKVRVEFSDDADNAESLISAASASVTAAPAPASEDNADDTDNSDNSDSVDNADEENDRDNVDNPATGWPTISGAAEVGATLTAVTSAISDADGLTNVDFAYQWKRSDGIAYVNIDEANASTYEVSVDDLGRTLKVQVSFSDDLDNQTALTSPATAEVVVSQPRSPFLVSNLNVGVAGAAGIQRTLDATRPAFAQAFTTGAESDGYALGAVRLQVSDLAAGSQVGDQLQLTINSVGSNGAPGAALCTLSNPSSLSAPGVLSFAAPSGDSPCPQLAAETSYFVSIEWTSPSGSDRFALIPQTYSSSESAATDEDAGGAAGWSIADQSYYLTIASEVRTWSAFDASASFKIEVAPAATANSPATGAPTIDGAAQAGETLTALTSDIADADGLSNVSYVYQWIRHDGSVDTEIEGQTGSTYVVSNDDVGKTLKVRVSFSDDADNEESLTSAATAEVIAAAQPPLTVSLSNAPDSHDGSTAFTFELTFSEHFPLSYSVLENYAFSATGGDVDRAQRLDPPSNIRWLITVDPDGEEDVTIALPITTLCTAQGAICTEDGRMLSNALQFTVSGPNSASDDPAPNNPATGAPTIDGTAQAGQTLTAVTSGIADADGLTGVSYSYQWLADDVEIAGQIGSTYLVSNDDVGKSIKVRVSFSDDATHSESLTSAATATVVAAANNPATGAPTIEGTAQAGQTLTAVTSGIADADGLTGVSYSYQWLADDVEISGRTGSTYEPSNVDVGKTIKVRVSFSDDANHSESLTSAATATVAPRPDPLTVSLENAPNSHDGSSVFTFDLRFSEEFALSYVTLKDHAFSETGGTVDNAQRLDAPSSIRWRITVTPSGTGNTTIVLPITTLCTAAGAICTEDGRMLSSPLALTISGPGN